MRDLLVQIAQQLLAHDLAHDLTVGLVGGHAVWEELRTLNRVLFKLADQLVKPVVRARGDGNDRVKGVRCAVRGDDREQILLLLDGIDLVDAQNRRTVALPDLLDQLRFDGADMRHRLDQQHHRVHVGDRLARDLDHIVAQAVARPVEARRVEQHKLRIAAVDDAADAVSRRLRFVGNDRDLLADKRVGKARFADVRTPADRDHGGFRDVHQVILNFL